MSFFVRVITLMVGILQTFLQILDKSPSASRYDSAFQGQMSA